MLWTRSTIAPYGSALPGAGAQNVLQSFTGTVRLIDGTISFDYEEAGAATLQATVFVTINSVNVTIMQAVVTAQANVLDGYLIPLRRKFPIGPITAIGVSLTGTANYKVAFFGEIETYS